MLSQNNPNLWDNGSIDGGNYWSDHSVSGNPSNGSFPYYINGSIINWDGSLPIDDLSVDHYPYQDPIAYHISVILANFTYFPENPYVYQKVTFDAYSSYDPEGQIVSYEWNFGDGNSTFIQDPETTHSYAEPGIYTVTLTVTYDDGLTDTSSIDITVYTTCSIPLNASWNLISLPIMPYNTDVLSVMSSVDGNWNSVWSYENGAWKSYDLSVPDFLNDLTTMESGKGYWVDMKSDDTLLVTGSEPADKSIPLTSGWNLVGYNSFNSRSTTDAMSSVDGNWNSVWSYENGYWKYYDLSIPDFLNDLTTMGPKQGYWIEMKSPDIWTLED